MSVMERRVRLFLITLYVNIKYSGWNNTKNNTRKIIFWLSRRLRKISRLIYFSVKCLNLHKSITSADWSLLSYYLIYFSVVCLCRYWVNKEMNIFGSFFPLIFVTIVKLGNNFLVDQDLKWLCLILFENLRKCFYEK